MLYIARFVTVVLSPGPVFCVWESSQVKDGVSTAIAAVIIITPPSPPHPAMNTATIRFLKLPVSPILDRSFSGTFWHFRHSTACNG